jgi:hypothetical protein
MASRQLEKRLLAPVNSSLCRVALKRAIAVRRIGPIGTGGRRGRFAGGMLAWGLPIVASVETIRPGGVILRKVLVRVLSTVKVDNPPVEIRKDGSGRDLPGRRVSTGPKFGAR